MSDNIPSNEFTRLPAHRPGMRIGIFGGSFDPPHEGHRAVSLTALKALGLDQIWWLVSPHNPLKPDAPSQDLERRILADGRGEKFDERYAENFGVKAHEDTIKLFREGAEKALAVGLVLGLGALNFVGRGSGAFAVNALVTIKLAALIGFVVVGAFFVQPRNLAPFAPHGYAPLGPAMLFAFFALSGFETSAVPGGETKHASRNIPIAVFGAIKDRENARFLQTAAETRHDLVEQRPHGRTPETQRDVDVVGRNG